MDNVKLGNAGHCCLSYDFSVKIKNTQDNNLVLRIQKGLAMTAKPFELAILILVPAL